MIHLDFMNNLTPLKHVYITRAYSEGKLAYDLEFSFFNEDRIVLILNLKCAPNEVDRIIKKYLDDKRITQIKTNFFNKIINQNKQELFAYKKEHIELRYKIINKYCKHYLTDVFYRLEHDMSDMYENFLLNFNK